jgi:hypothetical protein
LIAGRIGKAATAGQTVTTAGVDFSAEKDFEADRSAPVFPGVSLLEMEAQSDAQHGFDEIDALPLSSISQHESTPE